MGHGYVINYEYKVIDLIALKLADMTLQLNILAKEGWRVKTNLGSTLLVMEKETADLVLDDVVEQKESVEL